MKYILSIITLSLIFFGAAASFAAESAYTIPDELKSMSTRRHGWSAEEILKYRQEYNDNILTSGENDGAYAITQLSEVLPTAIVPCDGPIVVLESEPMPEIEDVVATPDLGAMTLRAMLNDWCSRMRASPWYTRAS